MRKRTTAVIVALGLAMAACQVDADPPSEDVATTATAIPVEPDGGTGAGAGPPMVVQADTIPQKYRGVWDYSGGNCHPASDLRMEVGPRTITYYESQGTVKAVKPGGKDGIIVVLAMAGEGEQWTTTQRLDLSADGKTLTPSDAQAPADHKPMPRTRCAT
ncbi:hypothetical protein MKP08_01130 [Erythrobacter sp. LQ02-29]|uniref:hypothetical protein n=1 Tax=Erythrobacter sp. LQ02-29 TaxID=2920384 RepID=UPI001F4E3495|nr:hypothetical protein [Erythrobacter sp. LQ02-29]MCP9221352.1 hypothetical protein [Erythrobacter sp. LQ02-29]